MSEMSSKKSDQRNKIVHAAGQLFAHQGYHGTSTRDIARIAEISENTLFRYFEHKEDLFWAALGSRLSGLKLRRELLIDIADGADPQVVLPQMLGQLVDTLILDPEALNLLAVAFIELRWKAESFCLEHLAPTFAAVNSYLAVSIEAGRLRKLNPSIVTAALVATVMVHSRISWLISGGHAPYADSRGAVELHSEFWLAVLTGPDGARPSSAVGISDDAIIEFSPATHDSGSPGTRGRATSRRARVLQE
jgi:AcrR family transcriptional regulator